MKKLTVLLALLLLLGCLTGCAGKAEPFDEEAAAARIQLDDFLFHTADGGEFQLSKALETHPIAVIYLFSTTIGACVTEIPNLQAAYEAYQDRVAVAALSISPDDDAALLTEYASHFGASFPMGNDSEIGFSSQIGKFPTLIAVDQNRNILTVDSEPHPDVASFTQLFDRYLAKDYRLDRCRYQVIFYDAGNMDRISGCKATFTLGEESWTVTSGEDGVAEFIGKPASYHVLADVAPDGYHIIAYGEYDTPIYDSVHYVALEPLPQVP